MSRSNPNDHPRAAEAGSSSSKAELSPQTITALNEENKRVWNGTATFWTETQAASGEDGNDMFTLLIKPQTEQLAEWKDGQTVLDLGAGTGIISRMFARQGAKVVGLDYSEAMINAAREIDAEENKRRKVNGKPPLDIEYDKLDLVDSDAMEAKASLLKQKEPYKLGFDIITISMTIKSMPDIEPLAKALPSFMKPGARFIIVDLHPVLSKPAGHRCMEILEDEKGKQKLLTCIKVDRYLDISKVKSEAVRGQDHALDLYHRPFWSLLNPFFNAGFMLDAMREPAFGALPSADLQHPQSYYNFPQIPMLAAFRLRLIPH